MKFHGKEIVFEVDEYADQFHRKVVSAYNILRTESYGDITLNLPHLTLDADELVLAPYQHDIIDEMVKNEYLVISGKIKTYAGYYKTARLTQKFEKEYGKAASRWQQTDERQYVRKISDGLYKLVEARHDTDRYIICMGDVSVKSWIESDGSYSDDCRKIISQYYSSVQNFEESYEDRDMREQVLAEILFEETCHTLTDRWEYVPDDLQAVQVKLVEYMTSI